MDELGQDIEIDDIIDTRFDFGLSEDDTSVISMRRTSYSFGELCRM